MATTIMGMKEYNATIRNMAAALQPCPYEGRVTEDQIKLAIGECLDIWPASIADDVIANAMEEREDD